MFGQQNMPSKQKNYGIYPMERPCVKAVIEKRQPMVNNLSQNLSSDETVPASQVERENQVDLGFDISTSVIGFCGIDLESGKAFLIGHLDLSSYEDEYDKSDAFEVFLAGLVLPEGKILRKIYIERAAMMFSAGMSSAQTIMSLGRFNGIISRMLYEHFQIKPTMVHVSSARARLGIKINKADKSKTNKQKVLEIVMSRNPDFPWISHVAKSGKSKGLLVYDKENEDRADAWVICKGGQLI